MTTMSNGGNTGLFQLAEKAAPREDRLMPTERTYLKSSATVSINEAIDLMKKRRADPLQKLKGGLDDDSEEVRVGYKPSVPVKPEVTTQNDFLQEIQPLEVIITEETQTPAPAKTKTNRGKSKDNSLQLGLLTTHIAKLHQGIGKLAERILGVEAAVNDLSKDSKEPSDTPNLPEHDVLTDFKAQSNKVTFLMNGMEFTVTCITMIKDETAHTVVLAFSEDTDAFFTPPMQSEIQIKYNGQLEPGHLYYFGMSFSLKSLGLKFLGFLYDDSVKVQD